MQLISCHNGKLHALGEGALRAAAPAGSFNTGLAALDELLPSGGFARGAMHELLFAPPDPRPLFLATLLAKRASDPLGQESGVRGQESGDPQPLDGPAPASAPSSGAGALVWLDPERDIYPPALAAMGVSLDRLYLVRSKVAEQAWAVAECLRCRGVAAVVAAPPRLSRVEARRLQLAAERGGGVGLLLRPAGKASTEFAAATRWIVSPAPGERTLQRWKVQLIHGHGGRVGKTVFLEYSRETRTVRASETVADRRREPVAFAM